MQATDEKEIGMSRKLRNKPPRKSRVNNNKITLNSRQEFLDFSEEAYKESVSSGWNGIHEFDATAWLDPIKYRKLLQNKGSHHVARVGQNVEAAHIRNTHIWALDHDESLEPIRAIYHHFNESMYHLQALDIQTPQMCVYYGHEKFQSGNGHYGWHQDTSIPRGKYQRILSMSIALNDATEYEGGKLQLLTGLTTDGRPKMVTADLSKAGNAVIFPSGMTHRVTPVTRGTRATCVTWLFGSMKQP